MIFPRMSLNCKLVPVQYREYEYGLLRRLLRDVACVWPALSQQVATRSNNVGTDFALNVAIVWPDCVQFQMEIREISRRRPRSIGTLSNDDGNAKDDA